MAEKMDATVVTEVILPERFSGKNYDVWRMRIVLILKQLGVVSLLYDSDDDRKYVEEPPATRNTKYKDYAAIQIKAKTIIFSAIEDVIVRSIKGCVSVFQIMQRLDRDYNIKSKMSMLVLREKLQALRYGEGGDLRKYLRIHENLVLDLLESGYEMSVYDRVFSLHSSLPGGYDAAFVIFADLPRHEKSYDAYRRELIKIYERKLWQQLHAKKIDEPLPYCSRLFSSGSMPPCKTKSLGERAASSKKIPQMKSESHLENLCVTCSATTSDGRRSNFKIASWNVAGIRACIKKNAIEYFKKEDSDILCLQEVKCSKNKVPSEVRIKGYHDYWCLGSCEGYSGVGIYSKIKPIDMNYGLLKPEYDSEGRVLTAEYDNFFLVNVYAPNPGRANLKNLVRRMQWDTDFGNYVKSLDAKKPVILCGDFNVAHQPIDLANPKTNTKSPGFTQEERDGMTTLLSAGFVDSYRHLYPEKKGAYTYWSYFSKARSRNVGWRLDYFILSKRYLDNVCDNVIRTEIYGSDHCPIVLYLNVP